MRRRSFAGPLLLLLIGAFFLWRNLSPEAPVFDIVARYWPFLLIGWGVLRLAEVAIWRRRVGIGFTGGEVVLIVLICIIGSALWEAHRHGIRWGRSLDVFGEQYDYPVTARASAAGMSRITFDNPRGNVKVTGVDGTEVTVNGHKVIRAWSRRDADRSSENTPVELVPQGDRLLIRSNQERVPENQRISHDLEVTVPKGVTVEARGRVGDVEITDINGNVELASDRADVRLTRIAGNARIEIGRSDLIRAIEIKGRVDIQGGNGSDLELENIGGQVSITGGYRGTVELKHLAQPVQFDGARNTELRAEAIPGRITMDLGQVSGLDIRGPLRLVTGSRDIKLERFTQSLDLRTERGDIELQPGSLPLPIIDARSGIGRIDLVLPEKSTFELEATAERGEVVNDYGPQIQKDTEGRTAMLKGKVGEGPSIRLVAGRGSVSVRKEGSLPSQIPEPADTPRPPRPPKAASEVRM
jgi:DUF4097 and DUF4098 domain-containing protein YvlB